MQLKAGPTEFLTFADTKGPHHTRAANKYGEGTTVTERPKNNEKQERGDKRGQNTQARQTHAARHGKTERKSEMQNNTKRTVGRPSALTLVTLGRVTWTGVAQDRCPTLAAELHPWLTCVSSTRLWPWGAGTAWGC